MNKNLLLAAKCLAVVLAVFYLFCANHTGANEIGVAFNSGNGQVIVQEHTGWYLTSPLVRVAYVSTIPQRVHYPTGANVQTVKLAMIKQDKIKEYLAHQGFGYTMGWNTTVAGYVFSPKQYPFIQVVE